MGRGGLRGLFLSSDLSRSFVLPEAQEAGMPEQARRGPFGETHLSHQPGSYPLDVASRRRATDEWCRRAVQRNQALVQIFQRPSVVTGTHLSRIAQGFPFVVPNQQGPESLTRSLGCRIAADHKFLLAYALELEPIGRPSAHVAGVGALCDNPFGSAGTGVLQHC